MLYALGFLIIAVVVGRLCEHLYERPKLLLLLVAIVLAVVIERLFPTGRQF